MYSIGICDDKAEHIDILKEYLIDNPCGQSFEIIDETDPYNFIERISSYKPDVIFLDVIIGDYCGIEIGKQIREMYDDIVIIYISRSDDYALKAFQVRAFNYLLKPVSDVIFYEAINLALNYIERQGNKENPRNFIVKTKKEIVCIKCKDIYYFEKKGHQIEVKAKNRVVNYYDNFTNLLEEIDDDSFIRCHQGYIVNVDKIKSFSNRTLYLRDNVELPVSRTYINDIKDIISEKMLA